MKKFFYPTYLESHRRWVEHNRLGKRWDACGEHLEYSLYLSHITDPEPRISKIAIRAKEGTVTNASFTFEASSASVKYQEHISVVDISSKPIVWNMTNIPCQELLICNERRGLVFSIEEYTIRNLICRCEDGREFQQRESLLSSLTHTWALNSTWDNKWGQNWNLDAIKWAKNELSLYWKFCFGRPLIRVYVPRGASFRRAPNIGIALTRPLSWVMATDTAISIQFWVAIWSGLCELDNDSRLQWKWKNKKKAVPPSTASDF